MEVRLSKYGSIRNTITIDVGVNRNVITVLRKLITVVKMVYSTKERTYFCHAATRTILTRMRTQAPYKLL